MKKLTKSVLAGGVGAALLLGSAGTIAFWTDEADGGSGVIQSGTLDIGTVGAGGWQISHVGDGTGTPTAPVAFDPATDQIVPGDVLTFTQQVPVTLAGENIEAAFVGDIAVTPTSAAAADIALADAVEGGSQLEVTGVTGAALTIDTATDTISGEGTGTVAVTAAITFPWGTTAGQFNDAKLGSLGFAVDYTLTQAPANQPAGS